MFLRIKRKSNKTEGRLFSLSKNVQNLALEVQPGAFSFCFFFFLREKEKEKYINHFADFCKR